jgi:hypothetical protein
MPHMRCTARLSKLDQSAGRSASFRRRRIANLYVPVLLTLPPMLSVKPRMIASASTILHVKLLFSLD